MFTLSLRERTEEAGRGNVLQINMEEFSEPND